MKFNRISKNVVEMKLGNDTVLFSYNTPVACHMAITRKYYRTDRFHSVTTSKHINQWLSAHKKDAILCDQDWFDAMFNF